MNNQYEPGELLDLVMDGFLRHGATEEECHLLRETILIRDGVYYGRSFRTRRLLATMIAESGSLQFHTSAGQLLESLPAPTAHPSAKQAWARRAA